MAGFAAGLLAFLLALLLALLCLFGLLGLLLLGLYQLDLVVDPRLRARVDERRGIQFGQRRERDGDRDCQSRHEALPDQHFQVPPVSIPAKRYRTSTSADERGKDLSARARQRLSTLGSAR